MLHNNLQPNLHKIKHITSVLNNSVCSYSIHSTNHLACHLENQLSWIPPSLPTSHIPRLAPPLYYTTLV